MTRRSIIGLVTLGLCLVGMLAMPVAATPGDTHQVQAAHTNSTIPQAVKDDLWSVHIKYRLQQFDLNVQKANEEIALLDEYQYDTGILKVTLGELAAKRPLLKSAVLAKDKTALKAVNADLVNLWKEFGKTLKSELKTSVTS